MVVYISHVPTKSISNVFGVFADVVDLELEDLMDRSMESADDFNIFQWYNISTDNKTVLIGN